MRKKLNNWERMEAVIRWANMSTNYFARYIGLAHGENLYQIKRGHNGISLDVADHVVAKFPQIDKLWLLTGEGHMFAELDKHSPVPYYKADAEKEIARISELKPDDHLFLPMVGGCDFAMTYNGQAMGRIIPAGTVVRLRSVGPDAIIPGGEYVIVSKKIVTLRIVRAAEDESRFRLVAGDCEHYDDLLLEKSDIQKAYKVMVKLIIND